MWYFVMQVFWGHKKAHLLVSLVSPVYLTPPPSPWPSPVQARELWRFCTGTSLCERRGSGSEFEVWVTDPPGSADGERLTWPVWSWKLTRLQLEMVAAGHGFHPYLLCVFKPFLKVFLLCFCTNGPFSWVVCTCVCKSICIFLFHVSYHCGARL